MYMHVCMSKFLIKTIVLSWKLQGPTMPALMIMLARWVPPHERSFQGALVFGGAQIGNIFGSFMSGFLLADGRDWAYVFYFFGGFGLIWFVLWVSWGWALTEIWVKVTSD